MINVLIVDDSKTTREFFSLLLDSEEGIKVVGKAGDGDEAIHMLSSCKPDIIIMDINMPKMSGYEATAKILEIYPVPIVICSTIWQPNEIARTFKAFEAGAVTALPKPPGPGHADFDKLSRRFIQTVKSMAEVRVVRRSPQFHAKKKKAVLHQPIKLPGKKFNLVVIGASTGGPPAIKEIIEKLAGNFSLPIVVVQHIAAGFLDGMVSWLDKTSNMAVRIARHGEMLQPGHVYLAPDKVQTGVKRGKIDINEKAPAENGLCPSVSYLFRSVAQEQGANAIGILLSGMGKDGAAELKKLRDAGGLTIAQNKESSVVHGMPGEAILLGGAAHILPPSEIAQLLEEIVNINHKD